MFKKGNLSLEFVTTENCLADIFTKPLPLERFCKIRRELGIGELPPKNCLYLNERRQDCLYICSFIFFMNVKRGRNNIY